MLIVITGPIASGKSTVARALAHELARVDTRAAVIDLDILEEMLTADGPKSDPATWTLARHAAATLANTFLSGGIDVVIADGSFNLSSDRATLEQYLSTGVRPLYVCLLYTSDAADE